MAIGRIDIGCDLKGSSRVIALQIKCLHRSADGFDIDDPDKHNLTNSHCSLDKALKHPDYVIAHCDAAESDPEGGHAPAEWYPQCQ